MNRHTVGFAVFLVAAVISAGQTLFIPSGTSGIGSSSNSYVGIGTSSPIQHLHVSSSSSPSTGIILENTATGGRVFGLVSTQDGAAIGGGRFSIYDDTGAAHRLTINAAGNVGIGATSPGRRLDVASDLGISAGEKFIANFTQLAGQNGIFLGYRGNGSQVSSALIRADNNLPITFGTSGQNEAVYIANGGNVGIGTTSPSHKLAVNGTIKTKEVIVETTGWADHVFADDYRLAPLDEVEAHIRAKRHLPGIPSAAEVAQQGISVGEMQARLLEKIEELTLHQIDQAKRLDAQAARIAALEAENAALRGR
ncbi:MAG TPA: hypothetical protein VEB66_06685 [Opitutaceae bacterium]|nr:hypothetical protein [Opitutaceae bacterium]